MGSAVGVVNELRTTLSLRPDDKQTRIAVLVDRGDEPMVLRIGRQSVTSARQLPALENATAARVLHDGAFGGASGWLTIRPDAILPRDEDRSVQRRDVVGLTYDLAARDDSAGCEHSGGQARRLAVIGVSRRDAGAATTRIAARLAAATDARTRIKDCCTELLVSLRGQGFEDRANGLLARSQRVGTLH